MRSTFIFEITLGVDIMQHTNLLMTLTIMTHRRPYAAQRYIKCHPKSLANKMKKIFLRLPSKSKEFSGNLKWPYVPLYTAQKVPKVTHDSRHFEQPVHSGDSYDKLSTSVVYGVQGLVCRAA